MRAWLLLLAACSGSDNTTPTPLEFAPFSPPQATSRDVFLAASGDTVVMSQRISRDGGATWQPLDAQLGQPTRVAITGTTVMTYANGLVRWDGTTVTQVSMTATDRTWRADPSGKAIAFDAVHNAITFEGGATTQLPGDGDAFIQDVESNGTIAMSVSAFGVHRFANNAWSLVAQPTDAGRDLLVLPDHRFLLFGGATSYLFDATGMPAGTRPGVVADIGDASACDDGAIVVHDERSTDLGTTWKPLIASGDLAMHVERIGCGGGRYWMLAQSDAWGYRLLSFAPNEAPRAAGNWEGATTWAAGGPQITLTDGTFLVAGLAWKPGDTAWTLREIPARAFAHGSDMLGIAGGQLYTSADTGATWQKQPTPPFADADAVANDGTWIVSTFSGDADTWHAQLWRASGASWTSVFEGMSSRSTVNAVLGDAHRFVGITDRWIATDATSSDGGATWNTTHVNNDHSPAFLAPDGRLIATYPGTGYFRVFSDGGEHLEQTYAPSLSGDVQAIAIDADGYAYLAGGSPYVQIWRSVSPL